MAFTNLTTFPLMILFLGSIIVIGQTQTPYQIQNQFGISNYFVNNQQAYLGFAGTKYNENINNITISSSVNIAGLSYNSCTLNTTTPNPLQNILNFEGYLTCLITGTITAGVASIAFSYVTSSANPQITLIGFIGLIELMIAGILLTGIQIVGTGINSSSIYLSFVVLGYAVIWIMLSGLSFPIWSGNPNSIPDPFGTLIYFFLSGMYVVGIFQKI